MEDINKKAQDDELNIEKGEDIHHYAPRKFKPVPKVIKTKEKDNKDKKK